MTKTVRKPGVIWIKMNHHNLDVYIALFFFSRIHQCFSYSSYKHHDQKQIGGTRVYFSLHGPITLHH